MLLSMSFEHTHEIFQDNISCTVIPRNTNVTLLGNMYEGIPETLILNLSAWVFLLLLFAILRDRAWDYGRLALVHSTKLTHLFYKNSEDNMVSDDINSSVTTELNCCSWLPSIFKISKRGILARCGIDAVHYLSFQRHLIVLSTIITSFALVVILPINFQGHLQGDEYTFGHTTLSNVDPNSNILWVHIFISFGFVPLTILTMRKCSSRIPRSSILSSRTVMVTHISRNDRNENDIQNYFLTRYPNIEIADIQIAYRVKKLARIELDRECVQIAKQYCMSNKPEEKAANRGCCKRHIGYSIAHYEMEEDRLSVLVAVERERILEHPLGIAFVTVDSEETARLIVDSYVSRSLRNWLIVRAPSPSDIFWENLEVSSGNWYTKAIAINCFLFIVLFFLTTPAIVVNVVNTIASPKNLIRKFSPFISEFIPTVLLLTVSGLMPLIVAYSDQWMSHWTRSKQNLAIMQKTYFFLLFMVLILPSLGLTSAQAFVEWSLQSGNQTYRWECVFLPDKGAFFVNYVITSSFIGTALELLRFSELALYLWRLVFSKSAAENIIIRRTILSDFPFGINYAWTLLIFTTSTVYSLTCPLITPLGLLYLWLKHSVDLHNLYFVYRPTSMSGEGQQIHVYAVRMVRGALILLQITMTAFVILRGRFSLMSFVSISFLMMTCGFFLFVSPFPSCQTASKTIRNVPDQTEQYIAPVLINSQHIPVIDNSRFHIPDYGTNYN